MCETCNFVDKHTEPECCRMWGHVSLWISFVRELLHWVCWLRKNSVRHATLWTNRLESHPTIIMYWSIRNFLAHMFIVKIMRFGGEKIWVQLFHTIVDKLNSGEPLFDYRHMWACTGFAGTKKAKIMVIVAELSSGFPKSGDNVTDSFLRIGKSSGISFLVWQMWQFSKKYGNSVTIWFKQMQLLKVLDIWSCLQ